MARAKQNSKKLPEQFDPYHVWLGIPKRQQPPTHYRLLGIPDGETDKLVIDEAVIRQTVYLRTYQLGEHAQTCTRLLEQVAQAGRVLLDPTERKAYDAQLKGSLAQQLSGIVERIQLPPWAWFVSLVMTAFIFCVGTLIAVRSADRRATAVGEQDAREPTRSNQTPLRLAVPPLSAEEAKACQEAWAEHLGVPVVTTNSLGMKLSLIPPGDFMMGSSEEKVALTIQGAPAWAVDAIRCESPRHDVLITKPYFMGQCEVTVAQFSAFVAATEHQTDAEKGTDYWGSYGHDLETSEYKVFPNYTWRTPGFPQTQDHPVVCVSHDDAEAFCKWLSETEGEQYRLPTEAEWEHACRAGTTTDFCCGDDPKQLATFGNVRDASVASLTGRPAEVDLDDGHVYTAPVGSFRDNAFGLYDMHGNAAEWCRDWYAAYYYMRSPRMDPQGVPVSMRKAFRGGSWIFEPRDCRSARRLPTDPKHRRYDCGFRVAKDCDNLPSISRQAISTTPLGDSSSSSDASVADRPEEIPPLAVAPFSAEQAKAHQQDWAKYLGIPVELSNNIGMKLVLIPPGEFLMGSLVPAEELARVANRYLDEAIPDPWKRPARWTEEKFAHNFPPHLVRITRPFYIGATEVTVGQFRRFVSYTGYRTEAERAGSAGTDTENWREVQWQRTDQHPVANLTWNDCQAFCEWLTTQGQAAYRLPTEAQWEYSCRAGTETWYYTGNDYEQLVRVGNINDRTPATKVSDGYAHTAPVGSFEPNAFGVHDMHGNVWEWTREWWAPYRDLPCQEDPEGPEEIVLDAPRKSVRGGAWFGEPTWHRSAARHARATSDHGSDTGFRIVRDVSKTMSSARPTDQ